MPDHGGYAASRYKARKAALLAHADTTEDALAEAPHVWRIPGRIKIKPRADDPRFNEIVQLDYQSGRDPSGPGQDISWDDLGVGAELDDEIEIPF